jgi:ribosomal protein S12 methylthiotransferase accessory factor
VLVVDCTVDTNVPIFTAYVYDRMDEGTGVCMGYGAHLDAEIALLRAITEALQGRLNFIAGARDDIFRAAFWRARGSGPRSLVGAFERLRINFPEATYRRTRATECFEADINYLLARLKRAGLKHVIIVDITPAGCPVHVVRIVVPGLEGYMHHEYRPGRRAINYAKGEAS